MGVVKGQGYVVSPLSKWFASFFIHMNQTDNSWDTIILTYDPEKCKVKVMGGVND